MFGKKINLGYHNSMKIDVAVIGGGPAGITAGIFASRAGLNVTCFERLSVGGQAALSYEIANYPGFENISGWDLSEKFLNHAKSAEVEFVYEDVKSVEKNNSKFIIKTSNNKYEAKKIIIATGCKTRKLNLENEAKFTGKGVSYCASCDGGFYKGKNVCVVGGGDSAMEYVNYLTRIANKIYLVNHSERFRANEQTFNKVKKLKNVEIITNANVVSLNGKDILEDIDLDILGEKKNLKVDGIFFAIGQIPDLSFVKLNLKKDSLGYLLVDENMQTNMKNVFACGDIISKRFKQVITACADGAIAGNSCIGGK